ncbi:ankyrin repeat domain-containing protein SOWAHA [Antennarius striatus]|uniref:ankyrin repeat domain-containing protein SOWAHA n=1 Tax=Antennarius striatus TaxID=241820 RepID=UPI0035AE45E6
MSKRSGEMALTQESILSFLLDRGGKVKNSELLNNFRSLIGGSDPAEKQHNRDLFKRLVNSVAVVKQIDEMKFVVVKKRYQDFVKEVAHLGSQKTQTDERFSSQNVIFSFTPPHTAEPAGRIYSDIENNNMCCPSDANDTYCRDAKRLPEDIMQDRKVLSRNTCCADTTVKVLSLSRDQTNRARRSGAVFAVIAVKSPPRDSAPATHGRSQTQLHQNKASDKPVKLATNVSTPLLPNLNFQACQKHVQSVSQCWKNRQAENTQTPGLPLARTQNKTTKQGDDVRFSDCVPLEPLAHEWLVKCAAGQWGQVYGLLLQDLQLAQKKDFMSGFTAMHWAAKDGNCKMIHKLMGITAKGGVCLSINSKAHGGYTPLHIAAIHSRYDVIMLLVQKYGANVNERDNDGKKAIHYLGKGAPAEVRGLLGRRQQGENKEKTEDEEYREQSKGLATFSKLFQPHMGKKLKPATKFAHDW